MFQIEILLGPFKDANMQKIVIAAYHSLVIKGVAKTLEESEIDCKIVGRTHSAKGLVELIKRYNPDVAVIDISITWKSGIDLLDEIQRIDPVMELHFICIHPSDKTVCEYMEKRSSNHTFQYIKRDYLQPAL